MFSCDQDMMDELLQSLYPVYSLAREFSNPYKVNISSIFAMNFINNCQVVRDDSEPWTGQKIDLQIDPVIVFAPSRA